MAAKKGKAFQEGKAAWISAFAAVAALVLGVLTWIGLSPSLLATATAHPCGDRLHDYISDFDNEADRVMQPMNLTVEYLKSSDLAGRVQAVLSWNAFDSATSSGLIVTTGRRGLDSAEHFASPTNADIPAAGECGIWYQTYEKYAEGQASWIVIQEGLWPGETYCFAVNAADEDSSAAPWPSNFTSPVCAVAPWKDGWGEPAQPGRQ
jgi:hypothetical protein